jgi:hypothetical protein
MRILKLPGITEIVTPAGKKQLYVIDPDEFGRYVVNHSDLEIFVENERATGHASI